MMMMTVIVIVASIIEVGIGLRAPYRFLTFSSPITLTKLP